MFRTGGAAGVTSYEGWATDAAAWTVTRGGEDLKVFSAQAARTFSQGGRNLFSSEQAASVAAEYGPGEVNVSLSADAPTRVRLFIGREPVAVRLDGEVTPAGSMNFNRPDGTVTFSVPAGEHRLSFSLR
jgi:hypothetical protein